MYAEDVDFYVWFPCLTHFHSALVVVFKDVGSDFGHLRFLPCFKNSLTPEPLCKI